MHGARVKIAKAKVQIKMQPEDLNELTASNV